MRRFLASLVLVCGLAAPAEAVTLRDLVDLSKQGLSDDTRADHDRRTPASPVYWGYGGKRRPDAWKPPVTK